LPIDKLLGLWYNGNNRRLGRGRAAVIIKGKARVIPSLTDTA
jgi:hypothetical protein